MVGTYEVGSSSEQIIFSSIHSFLKAESLFLQQRIGYAFYLHLLGTFCWLLAFLCAMTTTYKFLSAKDHSPHGYVPSLSTLIYRDTVALTTPPH